MAKKRRTRSQKIIAQLRRELKKERRVEKKVESKPKIEKKRKKIPITNYKLPITQDLYTYNQSLVKKDLLKTFYLSLIFFFFIGILYWHYQAGGEQVLQDFLVNLRRLLPF